MYFSYGQKEISPQFLSRWPRPCSGLPSSQSSLLTGHTLIIRDRGGHEENFKPGQQSQEDMIFVQFAEDTSMFDTGSRQDLQILQSLSKIKARNEASDPELRGLNLRLHEATERRKSASEVNQAAALKAENEAITALLKHTQG